MRVWKLTPLALIVLALGACSSQPAEQPAPAEPPAAAVEPPATAEPPVAEESKPAPGPAPTAKPANIKPSTATSKSHTDAAPAAAAPAPAPAAAVKDNTPVAPAPPPAPKRPEPVIIPAGTELNVVLADALNSGKNKPGDEFTANLAAPVYVNGATILDRGAKLQGKVLAAEGSGRVSGKASMSIALTGVTYKGKVVPVETKEIAAVADSSTKRDAGVIGGGAGVGALIGAIAGGKKGAAVGAAVGGGGGTAAVLATKGKEVDYPTESKLTFTLDKELSVLP